MAYFTNFQDYLFLCSDLSSEEKQKLDNYLWILECSGVSRIIAETVTKSIEKGGRPSHNPFRLFSAILFAFSKHSGSLRRIEDSIRFDTRFMYLMEQKMKLPSPRFTVSAKRAHRICFLLKFFFQDGSYCFSWLCGYFTHFFVSSLIFSGKLAITIAKHCICSSGGKAS